MNEFNFRKNLNLPYNEFSGKVFYASVPTNGRHLKENMNTCTLYKEFAKLIITNSNMNVTNYEYSKVNPVVEWTSL